MPRLPNESLATALCLPEASIPIVRFLLFLICIPSVGLDIDSVGFIVAFSKTLVSSHSCLSSSPPPCPLPSYNVFPSAVSSSLLSAPIYQRAMAAAPPSPKDTRSQAKLHLTHESQVFLLDQNQHIKTKNPIHQHLFSIAIFFQCVTN